MGIVFNLLQTKHKSKHEIQVLKFPIPLFTHSWQITVESPSFEVSIYYFHLLLIYLFFIFLICDFFKIEVAGLIAPQFKIGLVLNN